MPKYTSDRAIIVVIDETVKYFEPIVIACERREHNRLEEISKSETLKSRWIKYTKDYRYAEWISYEDVMCALRALINNF